MLMSDPHEITDSEILERSIQEPALFAVLVDRYQQEFLRKIVYMLKNRDDAQDIVQDAFVKIYVHAKKFKARPGATCKSWMYKILLNTCYSHCKKKKREKMFFDQCTTEDLDLFSGGSDTESKIILDRVVTTLSKIPQAMANLISENLMQGQTYAEIAQSERVPEGTVRTRMHRAKKEFQKAFSIYGE
jgi:RNA polymerase sigma-70 factor (ECF subfamily)